MELSEQIIKLASILQEIGSDLYAKAFQNQGISALTIGQFRYLEIIQKTPGITPSKLAAVFKVKKPTVTQIINELLRKKLVEKKRSSNDKRISNLYATKATIEIIQYRSHMYEIHAQRIQKILSAKELADYKKLNSKIINQY